MNGTNAEEDPIRNPPESIDSSDPETTFEEVDSDQIPETDIQFECPYCGKTSNPVSVSKLILPTKLSDGTVNPPQRHMSIA